MHGMTIRAIAKGTGLTERTIINLDKMRTLPASATVTALAAFIGWPESAIRELWERKTGREFRARKGGLAKARRRKA
jgi:predicted DNA-binding transcriptional regulator AlpA